MIKPELVSCTHRPPCSDGHAFICAYGGDDASGIGARDELDRESPPSLGATRDQAKHAYLQPNSTQLRVQGCLHSQTSPEPVLLPAQLLQQHLTCALLDDTNKVRPPPCGGGSGTQCSEGLDQHTALTSNGCHQNRATACCCAQQQVRIPDHDILTILLIHTHTCRDSVPLPCNHTHSRTPQHSVYAVLRQCTCAYRHTAAA